MVKIKATFTGTNGSLGYVTGKEYDLVLAQFVGNQKIHIHLYENGKQPCEYSNVITFLENWNNIKHL